MLRMYFIFLNQGRLIGVVKSTHILTEFGNDFVSHHSPSYKYDVSFSFNRTCLKRSHQAVRAALAPSFHHVLFPSCHPRTTDISLPSTTFLNQRFSVDQMSTIHNIIRLKGPPPYLINGPPSVQQNKSLSIVGTTITEAIFQIYFHMNTSHILVTSPKNHTCDALISHLNKRIPDSDLFRANASFREVEDVPDDVLSLCSHDGECFSSPSLSDLQKFRVIASTFMTCFRLQNRGVNPGYFSHIFMVDASSATEPDTMVALANFVTDETAVVITGSRTKYADRVRSDIARRNGLKRSYFHRLMESEPYLSNDPLCVCNMHEENKN